jgi:Ser-tRNA(Ala) deacylase AlaX
MTIKVFWENPYLTEQETYIASVDGNDVTVDQTIFYAFSGGQERDHGSIGRHPVVDARKHGKEIIYSLKEGHGLMPGDRVAVTIDWRRRYRLMRLHFAAEIVLELVYRHLPSIEKIGAHIAEDKARIDFAWDENIAAQFPLIEKEAARIIGENLDIISAFSDEDTEKRYWEIRDFPPVPCGGTHLRTTGEVGEIDLKRKNIGKSKERIEIYVNDSADITRKI